VEFGHLISITGDARLEMKRSRGGVASTDQTNLSFGQCLVELEARQNPRFDIQASSNAIYYL